MQAHDRFGSMDLNQWCFDLLRIGQGMSILELGCGTGKQSLSMAALVGDTGRITAVDISAEALDILQQTAGEQGVAPRIETRHADLDDLATSAETGPFDRVIACYSIYYTKQPGPLFRFLHSVLTDGGVLFFCGPSQENNAELKQFHNSLYELTGRPLPEKKGAAAFMEGTGQELAREIFGNAETFCFENPLRFDSAEALYSYWSSYNLYDRTLDEVFRMRAADHFRKHDVFETVKRVVGIRSIKDR
jgi:cyclopropane fatty-acyl-phospholipid synthase-like methyltransferase